MLSKIRSAWYASYCLVTTACRLHMSNHADAESWLGRTVLAFSRCKGLGYPQACQPEATQSARTAIPKIPSTAQGAKNNWNPNLTARGLRQPVGGPLGSKEGAPCHGRWSPNATIRNCPQFGLWRLSGETKACHQNLPTLM